MRICAVCGKEFNPITWNNKYCSVQCVGMKFLSGYFERDKKPVMRKDFKTFIEESQIKTEA